MTYVGVKGRETGETSVVNMVHLSNSNKVVIETNVWVELHY